MPGGYATPARRSPAASRDCKRTADREGETQRALMQDYAAELDRQTSLYYRRRQQLIETPTDPQDMAAICEKAAERVAARLAAAYLGPDFDGEYAPRFAALAEELRRDYAVGLLAPVRARPVNDALRTGRAAQPAAGTAGGASGPVGGAGATYSTKRPG